LVNVIDDAKNLHRMNHLCNLWFGNIEKALSKYLNDILYSNFDEIDPILCVTASISVVICALDKEFNHSANYPKGLGELFLKWIREYYRGVLL
jgi:hypothetical protein